MTREEAIHCIKHEFLINVNRKDLIGQTVGEALDMAIEALSAEPSKSTDQNVADVPSGDLVSRQTLIGAIEKCGEEKIYPQALIETIQALPSADRPQANSAKEKSIEQFLTLLTIDALKEVRNE